MPRVLRSQKVNDVCSIRSGAAGVLAAAPPLSKLLTALPLKCLVHLPRHGLDLQGNLQELRNTRCR